MSYMPSMYQNYIDLGDIAKKYSFGNYIWINALTAYMHDAGVIA